MIYCLMSERCDWCLNVAIFSRATQNIIIGGLIPDTCCIMESNLSVAPLCVSLQTVICINARGCADDAAGSDVTMASTSGNY